MNKDKLIVSLTRWQKIFKIGTIASTVVFGIIFAILFVWEAIAPYTAPMLVVWALVVATLFPYLFAGAYFVNELAMKIYTKRKKQT